MAGVVLATVNLLRLRLLKQVHEHVCCQRFISVHLWWPGLASNTQQVREIPDSPHTE
jgi:hypothetical protein